MARRKDHRVSIVERPGRHLMLRWLDRTGRVRERSSRTRDPDVAAAQAEALEEELARVDVGSPDQRWDAFRVRYELEHLRSLSRASRGMWQTTAAWVEEILRPRRLSDFNRDSCRRFVETLQAGGLKPESVKAYWRTLRAALSWAVDRDLLAEVPAVRLPRGERLRARSRAVTPAEFARILRATREVRPNDWRVWVRFMRGLYESGLRVDELRQLSWESAAGWWLMPPEVTGSYPLIRIAASAQKSRRDEVLPITPEFWRLASRGERRGWVFPTKGAKSDGQHSVKRIVRIISACGAAAKVVTDPRTGKTATSHDLGRRAFISRLDRQGMTLPEIQKWARHASIETTLSYYYTREAETLAAKAWGEKPT